MRFTAAVAALFFVAVPAVAQERTAVETRVGTLEKQMRSVQRRVFQPGSPQLSEVETPAPAANATTSNAMADLASRIDALERQLTQITGQVEENSNAIRVLDTRLDRIAAASTAPVAAPPVQPTQTAPTYEPAPGATTQTAPEPAASITEPDAPSADPAENAYLAGYRLWEAKRYDEAATTLQSTAKTYAKHRRASWARNLLGRTYLDDNKPATAAEAFLANYQELPQGERAADSLYYLGAALMKLNKPEQACKVYDELNDVYGSSMRDFLKANLPAARKTAKCKG